jgi:hypothetical protein
VKERPIKVFKVVWGKKGGIVESKHVVDFGGSGQAQDII